MDKENKGNVIAFPDSEEQEIHTCDSCASAEIFMVSHHFEDVDVEEITGRYLKTIFEAIEDGDNNTIVDSVIELFDESFTLGQKFVLKQQIHDMSAELFELTHDDEELN